MQPERNAQRRFTETVSDIMADFLDRASTFDLFPIAGCITDTEAEEIMKLSDSDFQIQVSNLPSFI